MLFELKPGLECKKCKSRITLGEDRRWRQNLVLKQDKAVRDEDFEVKMRCMDCMTDHQGVAFIRKGIFQGVHEYHTVTPADDKTLEGAKIYDDV